MKKTILNSLTICTLFFATAVNAQVGIGVPAENIHPSAELEVKSTTKGFLPPRMTKAQRLAMIAQGSTTYPAAGLLVFQTDGDANEPTGLYFFDGTAWRNGAGVVGAKGDKGDKGETGAQGLQGQVGAQGPKGETGLNGLPGATGPAGTQGIQGLPGANGAAGAQGPKGDTGLKGDKGETGAQGIQGEVGLQGIKGETGAIGAQGIQGIQGEIGLQGLQGQQGLQGATGLKGDKGETGPQGPQSTNDYLFMPSNMSQGGQISMLANSYYKMEIAPVDFTFSQITYFKLNKQFTNLSFGIYNSNGFLLATVENTYSYIAGLNTATFDSPVSLKKGEVFYLGYSSNFSNSNIFGIPLSSTYIPSSVYGFASYWVNGQCPFTMPTMTGTATAIPWYYLK